MHKLQLIFIPLVLLAYQSAFAADWQTPLMWDWILGTASPQLIALASENASQQAEIDALEARVIALEAENVGFNNGDLTGLAYCFYGTGGELTGGGAPGVYRSNYIGALSFTSSSGGTFLTVRDADAFLNTDTGVISGGVALPFSVDTMTYTVSGSGITISIVGEDDLLLHVSPDGNFMYGGRSDFSGSTHEYDSMMAIRSDAC
jgi:hypothetical protein